jgi:uncharacterized protein (TIRG00374 family)
VRNNPLADQVAGNGRAILKGLRATGILSVLFLGSTVALLVVFGVSDLSDIRNAFSAFSSAALVLVITLSGCNYLLRGLRWKWFCQAVQVEVGVAEALRHYVAGFAFGVTPARVGEVIRVQFLKSEIGTPYNKGMAIVIADRLTDLFALALLTALASVALAGANSLAYGLIVIVAAILVAALRHSSWLIKLVGSVYRVTGRAARLHAGIRRSFRTGSALYATKSLFVSLLMSLFAWFAECLGFYVVLTGLGLDIGVSMAALIYASATLIGALSFLPGGLGGFEAVAILGLNQAGVDLPNAIVAVTAIRILTLWLSVAVGWLVMGRMLIRWRKQGTQA